jgi:hypothetical protein
MKGLISSKSAGAVFCPLRSIGEGILSPEKEKDKIHKNERVNSVFISAQLKGDPYFFKINSCMFP